MKATYELQMNETQVFHFGDSDYDKIKNVITFINDRLQLSNNIGYWQIGSCLIAITNMLVKSNRYPSSSEWFKMSCPYTFISLKHGDDSIILPLNREYKPLGMHHDGNYPIFSDFNFQSIPTNIINLKSCPKILDDNTYYLYNDTTVPWRSKKYLINYQINLFKLLNFKIKKITY